MKKNCELKMICIEKHKMIKDLKMKLKLNQSKEDAMKEEKKEAEFVHDLSSNKNWEFPCFKFYKNVESLNITDLQF